MFSHAGILPNWLEQNDSVLGKIRPGHEVEELNRLFHAGKLYQALGNVSSYRGGAFEYGSCIWADIHEHLDCELYDESSAYHDVYQIFGHTISFPEEMKPWITDEYAMLDAQQCFVLSYDDKTFRLLKYSEYKDEVG